MANLGMNFDASQVAPSESFDAIPAGNYLVQIINSEMRPTKIGDGQFLWLEHEILDGQFQGRKLWNNINLVNQSAEAVQIAQRQLSAICHSINEMNVQDSEQLHFKPLIAVVKMIPAGFVRKGKNGRPDYTYANSENEIGGYKPAEGAAVQPQTQQQRPAAQAQQRPVTQPQTQRPVTQQPAAQPATRTAPWHSARTAA